MDPVRIVRRCDARGPDEWYALRADDLLAIDEVEYAAVQRADYDALVKQRDEAMWVLGEVLPALEHMEAPCDGVRWHYGRMIRAILPKQPPA